MRWRVLVPAVLIPGAVLMILGRAVVPLQFAFLLAAAGQLVVTLALFALASRRRGDGRPDPSAWGYRPRRTDAGRWLGAPVAELDKSTTGKLLASRMGRVPGLNVSTRPGPSPDEGNPLYDAELDG